MPTCRCKMCGGQIQYGIDDSVAKCEYCCTEQTVVKTDDTKKLNLFNRANSLRLQNEFDKAQTTYENILIDDPNNSEAHWGICLCRYGIEYVDDKKTNKKVPTCHRTVYKFIYDDIDYIAALENADVVAKSMYEKEAKVIDEIQKNILAISQKEDPYDIFICYKETDEKGNRTKDSVIAQDIYNELTKKGYKVFFSRITLESKLGSEYEPIIFAALMSSKIMLAIGSKIEFFNSPWVKNEWGRFLSFMKDTQGKYLIPCYLDMEAYDMPEEFLMLQAQDIGKIGYLQDLSRGIDKLMGGTKVEKSSNKIWYDNPQISNMFKRVDILLNESDFDGANGVLENILNIDFKCAEAYFYKILVNRKLKNEEELINSLEDIENDKNYIRALKYASEDYEKHLDDIIKSIEKKKEEFNFDSLLKAALNYMEQEKYDEAMKCFKKLPKIGKINDYVDKCNEGCYNKALSLIDMKMYDEAIAILELIVDYSDSNSKIEYCKKQINIENEINRYQHIKKVLEDLLKSIKVRKYIRQDDERIFNKNIKALESIEYGPAKPAIPSFINRFSELKRQYPNNSKTSTSNNTKPVQRRNKWARKWTNKKAWIAAAIIIGALFTLPLLYLIIHFLSQ